MTLYEECLSSLGDEVQEYQGEEAEALFNQLQDIIPFTNWGKIDWDKVQERKEVKDLSELGSLISGECLIFWDEASLPVLKAKGKSILSNLDDVLAVSFDTWVADSQWQFVVEFHHDGRVAFGLPRTST